jgi:protein-S-isoprenylcysteine O-methyltransferase Ste14
VLLLLLAYVVFRWIVRRGYAKHGRLTLLASVLQLLVFAAYMPFPCLFNPPEWLWFWRMPESGNRALFVTGFVVTCLGLVIAFGTMGWFGIRKAFGLSPEGLTTGGLYRSTRNPQILGGYLVVVGTSLQWPTVYALGWLLMYAIIGHWMVITEEEHLLRVFGEAYERYCARVPRYLGPRRSGDPAT